LSFSIVNLPRLDLDLSSERIAVALPKTLDYSMATQRIRAWSRRLSISYGLKRKLLTIGNLGKILLSAIAPFLKFQRGAFEARSAPEPMMPDERISGSEVFGLWSASAPNPA